MLLKRTIVLFWDGSINDSLYIYLPHYPIFNVFVLHHRPPFSLVNSSHSGRVTPEPLSRSSLDSKPYKEIFLYTMLSSKVDLQPPTLTLTHTL